MLAEDRRLVVLFSSHRTGSGSRQQVNAYACNDKGVTAALQAEYTNGASIEPRSADVLIIKSGAWSTADPVCCPSSEQRETFKWSPSHGRFDRELITTSPRQVPSSDSFRPAGDGAVGG
jgi:hypothetical protein